MLYTVASSRPSKHGGQPPCPGWDSPLISWGKDPAAYRAGVVGLPGPQPGPGLHTPRPATYLSIGMGRIKPTAHEMVSRPAARPPVPGPCQ